jgi:hypothetical protein
MARAWALTNSPVMPERRAAPKLTVLSLVLSLFELFSGLRTIEMPAINQQRSRGPSECR